MTQFRSVAGPVRAATLGLLLAAGLGCSGSTDLSLEPQEVLLAVNSTANTLSIVPLDAASGLQVALGGTTPSPTGVSARGSIAVVPLGLDNAVAVVDLRAAAVLRRVPLPDNSGATGSVVVDDSIAYVANPNINSISRVNYLTGASTEVAVGRYPQALALAGGELFVINGNLENFAPAGPSWITVIDPTTNARAGGIDSIPLSGPGNAQFVTVGGDGLLYVMSSGSFNQGEGLLSIVDPAGRAEVASAGGFGASPGDIASDGGTRLFVSSYNEGLMEFDTGTRQVVRGAGHGVQIPANAAVAVDGERRIYAIEQGACASGQAGVAHVLDVSLAELRTITLGECPAGARVVQVPAE